ncbi:hypothetical protein [Paenibacillus sp. JDR-2]|uniref:hypothetical protein n=1 Tax=Paenibacillus sp. (strain JDR-2) TaxID=324057 RepID=UPI0001665C7F|nr:hypothetical protein [Paenibacillus sp. JDR-2]ACT03212.1 hypothetical protein Pjdr2_4597 [Paenibacillus sp. JDR-2]
MKNSLLIIIMIFSLMISACSSQEQKDIKETMNSYMSLMSNQNFDEMTSFFAERYFTSSGITKEELSSSLKADNFKLDNYTLDEINISEDNLFATIDISIDLIDSDESKNIRYLLTKQDEQWKIYGED